MNKTRFLQALFLLFCSCNLNVDEKEDNPSRLTKLNIVIQPFNDIPYKYVKHVQDHLKLIYPNVTINKAISLPQSAYYKNRNRYRADTIIAFLKRRTPTGHVTIGMTSKDISTTKGEIIDYGIMGLGYQPGKSCVVSTYRLDKNNLNEQFFKLSIHELGHTQGLEHCESLTCFMRDAKGKNHTNEEKEFCPVCKKHLSNRGWMF